MEMIDKYRARMTLEQTRSEDWPDECSIIISVTDDPTMNSAADWTQLGYGRLKIGFRKAVKIVHPENFLTYQGELVEFEMLRPQRPVKEREL